MSRVSKFCARRRSQIGAVPKYIYIYIFHLDSNSIGTPGSIEPWSECQPKFPEPAYWYPVTPTAATAVTAAATAAVSQQLSQPGKAQGGIAHRDQISDI